MLIPAIKLYGIANCDTIKKAKAWLDAERLEFEFHDYRKQGLDRALLVILESKLGWETLLNRRGTSWRQLPDSAKNNIDQTSAIALMLANPTLIKRPILVKHDQYHVGFSADLYREIFD